MVIFGSRGRGEDAIQEEEKNKQTKFNQEEKYKMNEQTDHRASKRDPKKEKKWIEHKQLTKKRRHKMIPIKMNVNSITQFKLCYSQYITFRVAYSHSPNAHIHTHTLTNINVRMVIATGYNLSTIQWNSQKAKKRK